MTENLNLLPLTDTSADSSAGCSCCATSSSDGAAARTGAGEASSAVSADYLVSGMTCAHCVSSVTEELSAVPGVTDVTVDLKVGGLSRVTVGSATTLDPETVRAAVAEAGYSLADR